jgi:preprotein translocase subunit SecY
MSFINSILNNLPEVKAPDQKHLPFKTKLIWTFIILIGYFLLGVVPMHGLGENGLQNFDFLSIILGAQFGSLISLGIGPIVTASIVLQLLMGSGLLKIDTATHEGRVFFQGIQKLTSVFFIVFESIIYVFLGGLSPSVGFSPWYLIGQLIIGGLLILYMDEVTNKWGIGSGVSLFIAAGVSSAVFIQAFSPLTTTGTLFAGSGQAPIGRVLVIFLSLFQGSVESLKTAVIAFSEIAATIIVFLLVVYIQSMKVEIPLSFGRVRGYGIRWPLKFIYTSNIPVILVAALLANFQLWARLLESWGRPLLGTFAGNQPATGFVTWIFPPNLVRNIFAGTFAPIDLGHSAVYALFMVVGSIIFSIFWVQTSGMDAGAQAKQILGSGLQIPGFRRDARVLETILKRYITPLTVMGGATVGLLAAIADISGALSRGTGILLAVMIIYKFYEDIAQQHMMDMNPAMRKFMGGSQ